MINIKNTKSHLKFHTKAQDSNVTIRNWSEQVEVSADKNGSQVSSMQVEDSPRLALKKKEK